MSLSLDLLAQARILATREPRKPKDASIRRAISTAYYSLFHYLGEHCTRLTVGAGHERLALRQYVGRAFVHGKMKAVCEEFLKTTPKDILQPFWPTLHVTTNIEVKTIARNFVDLQEQRHTADYDLSAKLSRAEALAAADLAEEAMDAWDSLKGSNEQLAQLFAMSLMLWPALGSRS